MKTGFTIFLALTIASAQAQNAAVRKGNAYYRNGDFVLAEVQYRESNSSVARFNLGNALIQQKKYREALAVLESLANSEKDPRLKGAAFYNAGVIYSRQKDLERSIEAYKGALRANPGDSEARENLQKALLEWKQQQREKALQQQKPAPISRREAERKLAELQQKEQQLQQRLQSRRSGRSMENDW